MFLFRGATRLGSNSLLDLVVFGRAAAIRHVAVKFGSSKPNILDKHIEKAIDRFDKIRNSNGKLSLLK